MGDETQAVLRRTGSAEDILKISNRSISVTELLVFPTDKMLAAAKKLHNGVGIRRVSVMRVCQVRMSFFLCVSNTTNTDKGEEHIEEMWQMPDTTQCSAR